MSDQPKAADRITIKAIKSLQHNSVLIVVNLTNILIDNAARAKCYVTLTCPEARKFIAALTVRIDAEEAREAKRRKTMGPSPQAEKEKRT